MTEHKIEYRSFLGDDGYTAKYKSYFLSRVVVREIFATSPTMVDRGHTVVYFFPDHSVCTDEDGAVCRFPTPAFGDRCVLRAGEEDERVLVVAEAGLYTGEGALSHVRLKLR